MKTLQEKYTGVREGKFSQFQWLKEAKLTLPHLISPYNGFEDAVQILKNRGMLHEEVKADLKKTDKSVEDANAKSFSYGEMSAANVNFDQMLKGMQIEIEKDPELSEEKAREKAIKNLVQDPYFYLKNQAFGIEGIGYTEDVPGLKPSKTDQMEKVKLNENKMISLVNLLENGPLGEKPKRKKTIKKEKIDTKLAEIDKVSQIVALEAKIQALEEVINSKKSRINLVNEDNDLSELIDKTKIKAIQKEVKILEKRKAKMEKLYEKMCGKRYKRMVDEESNGNSNLGSNDNSNENSNENPESYSGLEKFKEDN